MTKQLPLPSFWNPANASKWDYRPNQRAIFEEAVRYAKLHGIKAASNDKKKIHVLGIDKQKDFDLPEGSLYVGGRSGTGAIDDSRRFAEFVYQNIECITGMTFTFDTHFAFQIFTPSFWLDEAGNSAQPFTFIKTEDIRKGIYRPNPIVASFLCNGNYSWLMKQVIHYCNELEKAHKYTLCIWPEHTVLGSDGHALTGITHEVRMFHAYVRGAQSHAEVKGGHPLTENYSVLGPEVMTYFDGRPMAQKNTQFMKTLLSADVIIIGGQAASHCVKSSIDDLLGEILVQDSELAKKVYVMADCMSAVTVPDGKGGFFVDFTSQAEEAFKRYKAAGMHLVNSTDPLASWPGVNL